MLAHIRRNEDDCLQARPFGFDRHHGSAGREHAAGRDLDLDHSAVDRTRQPRIPLDRAGNLLHLPARLVHLELGGEPVELTLRFGFAVLAIELIDLVQRIRDPLLGRGKLGTPILQLPAGRQASRNERLTGCDGFREIGNALLHRCDDLLESGLLRSQIGGLDFELAFDRREQVVALALALLQHFEGVAMAMLGFGLGNTGDDLTLGDLIPDRHLDRDEPARRAGNRIDHAAGVADQNSFAGNPRRNPAQYAPARDSDQGETNRQGGGPVYRPCHVDKLVEILRR